MDGYPSLTNSSEKKLIVFSFFVNADLKKPIDFEVSIFQKVLMLKQ